MRFAPLLLLLAACAGPDTREVSEILERLEREPRAAAPALSWIDEAVRSHPRVLEARARAEAAVARARGAGSLDDPMLFFTAEQVPLRNPASIHSDEFNAAGLSQTFPLFKLGLREEAAVAAAGRAAEEARRTALEVRAAARRAWADHAEASAEKEIHERHAALLTDFVSAAEIKYSAGKVTRQDVLDGQNETSELHAMIAETDARIADARARLRELTGRETPPPLPAPPPLATTADEAWSRAERARPDLRAAERAVRGAELAKELAGRERWIPDVTAEAMVMQMPGEPDAWGATIGFSLPWFSPKRKAEEEAAGRELDAERSALEAGRRAARREVAGAHARVAAALRSLEIREQEGIPRARQGLEVAKSGYEKERIDFLRYLEAERALRQSELEALRARARAQSAWADLEESIGGAP